MKSKKSAVRFSGASTDLLHNKYILYLSFFFAVLTAARYLFNFNLEAIIIFVVLGFLTTYFSKNMIVILLTTTIGTNFIMMFKNKSAPVYYNIMEGLVPHSDSATTAPPADATNGAPPTTGGASAPATSAPNAGADAAANQDLTKHMNNMVSAINAAKNGVSGAPPVTTPTLSNNDGSMPNTATPAVNAFTKKKSEAMTQLSPASYGGSSGDNALSSMFSGMAAGATGQKNQAYDAMNSLGGSANTGNLLGQQTEMINNLKSIEPILNTAEKFLDKFENSSISKMFQNMGSIPGMSLLTGGGGNGGGNGLNPASVGS
jgi:hypothetical protein